MRLGSTGCKSPVNELWSFLRASGASRCSACQSGSDSSSSSVLNLLSGSSTSACIPGSSGGCSSSSGSSGSRGMPSGICRYSSDATFSFDSGSAPSVPMRTASSSSCGKWFSSPFTPPPPVAAGRGMCPPSPAAGCQIRACRQMMAPVVRWRTRKVPRGR